MEIIRFRPGGGAVSFRVEVTGLVVWRYRYDADGAVFVRKSSEGPGPSHALGNPEELRGDVNSWDVHMVSPDEKSRDYRIEVSWSQDGGRIHHWQKQGKASGDTPVTERGDAFLLEAK